MRLVYHPAGHDEELRVALVELEAGRWRTARELLLETGTHWTLRTSRTQLLAVAAARSDVVGVWLAEEPDNYDAQLMAVRVAVERALRAHRQQHSQTLEFEIKARRAALLAARRAPYDPVPWVCLVALAQIDTQQLRQEHRLMSAEPMLPSGPWGLLYEVNQRDPYNREAYHRVLQFMLALDGLRASSLAAVVDFGWSVAGQRPVGLATPASACVRADRAASGPGRSVVAATVGGGSCARLHAQCVPGLVSEGAPWAAVGGRSEPSRLCAMGGPSIPGSSRGLRGHGSVRGA